MKIEGYRNTEQDMISYFGKNGKELTLKVKVTPKNPDALFLAKKTEKELAVAFKGLSLEGFRYKNVIHMDNNVLRVWMSERKYSLSIDIVKEKKQSFMQWIKKEPATYQAATNTYGGFHSYYFDQSYQDKPVFIEKCIKDFYLLESIVLSILREQIKEDITKIMKGEMTSEDLILLLDENELDLDIQVLFKERI